MACLVDKRIINRKYIKIADENNEPVDNYSNREDYYVQVPCGRCINCVKSYMTQWRQRLLHEYEYMTSDEINNSYFITLTFSPEHLQQLYRDFHDNKDLKATLHIYQRRFFDRLRKRYGSTPRHWLVTEYGERSGRLHLHGILFNVNFPIRELYKYWQHGFVNYTRLNERRIGYCTKYITKAVEDVLVLKSQRQYVFTSPGLGKAYTEDPKTRQIHHPKDGVINTLSLNSSGYPMALPRYYRNKIFDDTEREELTLAYFAEQSDDVIPNPPYNIGRTRYTDYTLYLDKCEQIKINYESLKRKKLL
ncbi:MAG: hypothetical protein J6Q07_01265 [Alistipes sp.]|nr:hypothetical protein [Alistipes sp.]